MRIHVRECAARPFCCEEATKAGNFSFLAGKQSVPLRKLQVTLLPLSLASTKRSLLAEVAINLRLKGA